MTAVLVCQAKLDETLELCSNRSSLSFFCYEVDSNSLTMQQELVTDRFTHLEYLSVRTAHVSISLVGVSAGAPRN